MLVCVGTCMCVRIIMIMRTAIGMPMHTCVHDIMALPMTQRQPLAKYEVRLWHSTESALGTVQTPPLAQYRVRHWQSTEAALAKYRVLFWHTAVGTVQSLLFVAFGVVN